SPVIHSKMYAIGGKYNVQVLKKHAFEKYENAAVGHFTSESFYKYIDVAYTITPESDTGLRDVVAKYFCEDLRYYGMFHRLNKKLHRYSDLTVRIVNRTFGGNEDGTVLDESEEDNGLDSPGYY
ncbi:hypothetical protein K469DRAFT_582754, partial [Zopfia rhizophila CBS 207.26]